MPPLLDGVRVVDLSRVLAAPFAGRVFAELGAEVVKVEYGGGDPAHSIGPHWGDRSLYYSSLNSGKEAIWLDLRQASDRDALHELLAGSDVLLENFKSSTAASL
ncbi:MAG TPA: CoA transferase, partial [Actinomycetota bacterium]|nr:CoA transferase [Actinomycetota bacterium]